jgi:hypothetical protein
MAGARKKYSSEMQNGISQFLLMRDIRSLRVTSFLASKYNTPRLK